MENTVVWADIPVTDLDRAMKFYGAVLQRKFVKVEGMDGIALEAPPENPPDMTTLSCAIDGLEHTSNVATAIASRVIKLRRLNQRTLLITNSQAAKTLKVSARQRRSALD